MPRQFDGLSQDEQRKLLGLCFELVASVSAANIAKRGDRLPDSLVNGFAIRELADMLEELAPGAAQKIRDAQAAVKAKAAQARLEQARARAVQVDAERQAQPTDPWHQRALPRRD